MQRSLVLGLKKNNKYLVKPEPVFWAKNGNR